MTAPKKNGKDREAPPTETDIIPIALKLETHHPTKSDKIRCGDLGGRTKDGKPCQKFVRDKRPCPFHRRGVQTPVMGRPRIIDTPEQFNYLVDLYHAECAELGIKPTHTGTALALGFADRASLYDYDRNHPEFSHSVKRAVSLVEQVYERHLLANTQAAGAIFALKQYGWTDRQELTHAGSIDVDMPNVRRMMEERLSGIRERMGPVASLPAVSGNGEEPE